MLISCNYHVIQKMSDQQGKLKELKAQRKDANTTSAPGVQQQATVSQCDSYYLHFFWPLGCKTNIATATDPKLPFCRANQGKNLVEKATRTQVR